MTSSIETTEYEIDGMTFVTVNSEQAEVSEIIGFFEQRAFMKCDPRVEVTLLWRITDDTAEDASNACNWSKPRLSDGSYVIAYNTKPLMGDAAIDAWAEFTGADQCTEEWNAFEVGEYHSAACVGGLFNWARTDYLLALVNPAEDGSTDSREAKIAHRLNALTCSPESFGGDL